MGDLPRGISAFVSGVKLKLETRHCEIIIGYDIIILVTSSIFKRNNTFLVKNRIPVFCIHPQVFSCIFFS